MCLAHSHQPCLQSAAKRTSWHACLHTWQCLLQHGLTYMHPQATLLVGGPGTAKTAIINSFMAKLPSEQYSSKTITFSSLSTPGIFQSSVEVRCCQHAL